MNKKTNIVLIGMPASGKSTLGVQLAKWRSMGFIDTDLLVQARAGMSMQAYQDAQGMDAYRTLEGETARSLVCKNCVIATGGSVVYYTEAMQHLQSIAHTVFLNVSLAEIKQRIGNTAQRGVVMRPGMTLDDLYLERQPLYLNFANTVINCAEKSQDTILKELQRLKINS